MSLIGASSHDVCLVVAIRCKAGTHCETLALHPSRRYRFLLALRSSIDE
jgi:hypothetical protein